MQQHSGLMRTVFNKWSQSGFILNVTVTVTQDKSIVMKHQQYICY